MAAPNANRLVEPDKVLKDDIKNDDSKANSVHEEVITTGEIQEAQISSSEPAGVGNDEDEEDVKEMNYDKEAMEDLISKLHIGELPTIGKKLRCRGRSALLLFYRLWRDHLVKKPPPL